MEKETVEVSELRNEIDENGYSEKQSAIAIEHGVGEFKVIQKQTQSQVLVQKKKKNLKRQGILYDAKDMEELD